MGIKLGIITTMIVLLMACRSPKEVHYQGYVEGENAYLSSSQSGTLVKMYVHRGEWVDKGMLLFQLDPNPDLLVVRQQEATLMQAKKIYEDMVKPRRLPEINAIKEQVAAATAHLQLAELRLGRMQALYLKQAIDKDAVDSARAQYEADAHIKAQYEANLALALLGGRASALKAQEAAIDAQSEKVKEAKWRLAQKNIYAPAAGQLFETYFLPGEFVPSASPIASLLSPEHVYIEFFVPATALDQLHVGMGIFFDCDGCRKRSKAYIGYISPEAEYVPPLVYSQENQDKLVFRIKATISSPSRFKPGEPVTVTVVSDVS